MFNFTPTEDQGPGSARVTVRVSDSFDPVRSDFETITVTVNEVDGENQCLVLTAIGDRTVDELASHVHGHGDRSGRGPDAHVLARSGLLGGRDDRSVDGRVQLHADRGPGPGSYTVTVRVSDSFDPACSDFETITVTVNEVGGGRMSARSSSRSRAKP